VGYLYFAEQSVEIIRTDVTFSVSPLLMRLEAEPLVVVEVALDPAA
jgi:hypothetical protein